MFANERYQMFCRFCFRISEGDSIEEVLTKVEEHEENECPRSPLLRKK